VSKRRNPPLKREMKRILVTGSVGQIGSELTLELRRRYGADNVIATGRKTEPSEDLRNSGPFHFIDCTRIETIEEIVTRYDIDTIYHMAAILSAVGEKNPQLCWNVNMNGTINVLELGLKYEMARIIVPSSIAVWGPGIPLENTPQETVLRPTTMYGVTKVCAELLCDYYVRKFGLDIRGLRYPGIISYETLPGGGTTDYAVAIFYEAVDKGRYTCFVREDTRLPMMYMPDCIDGTIQLAEADFSKLNRHSDFNHASMSFSAGELAAEIRKHIPNFEVTYEPDYRQAIADSWPNSIDDSAAREEWGWKPKWGLSSMTEDMIKHLQIRKRSGTLYR
jgi:nucleoside-diphosphate-sugar epimerase